MSTKRIREQFEATPRSSGSVSMANQQVIDRASQRARAGLEVAPEFFAQIAGALFGILSGIKLLLGAFIADVKSLSSTTGRRQIFYGRQGPKPVTFEGPFAALVVP